MGCFLGVRVRPSVLIGGGRIPGSAGLSAVYFHRWGTANCRGRHRGPLQRGELPGSIGGVGRVSLCGFVSYRKGSGYYCGPRYFLCIRVVYTFEGP